MQVRNRYCGNDTETEGGWFAGDKEQLSIFKFQLQIFCIAFHGADLGKGFLKALIKFCIGIDELVGFVENPNELILTQVGAGGIVKEAFGILVQQYDTHGEVPV